MDLSSRILSGINAGVSKALNEMAIRTGILEQDVIGIDGKYYYDVYKDGKVNLMDFDGNYMFDEWYDDIIISDDYITLFANGKIINIDK